ncbi:hypothetical protein HDV64DRAFT_70439 [Trichoderma sp. TUCIM 5745]
MPCVIMPPEHRLSWQRVVIRPSLAFASYCTTRFWPSRLVFLAFVLGSGLEMIINSRWLEIFSSSHLSFFSHQLQLVFVPPLFILWTASPHDPAIILVPRAIHRALKATHLQLLHLDTFKLALRPLVRRSTIDV